MLIRKKQADERIKEEKVKEEREARYRAEERNNQKYREAFTQLISTMTIQAQNNLNQLMSQSINSGEKSVLNISTITDESTQAIMVSSVTKINVPKKLQQTYHSNHSRKKRLHQSDNE